MRRCPGQDTRYWNFDDIFTIRCPSCGGDIEFFKDDIMLSCPWCGREVRNPRERQGCAQWCASAGDCGARKETT